jgi:hypothetical protein
MDNSMIFNIIAKKENGMWIAHCLELDIVATASSKLNVIKEINDLIVAQIDYAFSNNNLDNLYKPAPAEVWKEFYACKESQVKRIKIKRVKFPHLTYTSGGIGIVIALGHSPLNPLSKPYLNRQQCTQPSHVVTTISTLPSPSISAINGIASMAPLPYTSHILPPSSLKICIVPVMSAIIISSCPLPVTS